MRMAHITLNNRLIQTSINNNYKFLFFGLILIIYFGWMDIALFVNLQRWSPPPIEQKQTTLNPNNITHSNNDNPKTKTYNHQDPFSVFKPLSVKLIMIDHVTHYVHDILARFLADNLHITRLFPWITANVVSFTGLFVALIGCKLTLSDKLFYRQIGALLFEARNLADSLDGVVYRSRKRDEILLKTSDSSITTSPQQQIGVYQSFYGTLGYNVDVICDGLAGLVFVLCIFIRFLRHPPVKSSYFSTRILSTSCESSSNDKTSGNYSNYMYHRLNEKSDSADPNYSLIQMDELNSNGEESTDPARLDLKKNPASLAAAAAAFSTPVDSNTSTKRISRHFKSKEVGLIVIFFGIRLLFTGLIWDHFVHKYHDLLMVFSSNPIKRKLQGQAFKSIGMWLIMWFWRIGNACSILEHLVITTFFDKLWEYLVFTHVLGWAFLVILGLFTQIHYIELYESLNSITAFI